MNKYIKRFLLGSALTLGGMAIINKALDIFATSKYSTSEKELTYSWTYGKIKYIKKGHGRPLLLVHGLRSGQSRREWDKVIGGLSKKYTVYSINMLGFGSSDKPNMIYNSYTNGALINSFIKNVIGKKTAVCASGESASALTMAYTVNPKNISRIIFVSPELEGRTPSNTDKIKRSIINLPIIGTFLYNVFTSPLSIKAFINRTYSDSKKANSENIMNMYLAEHMNGGGSKVFASSLVGLNCMDSLKLLEKIELPITVLGGVNAEIDGTVDVIGEIHPNTKFYIFEETGDFPHRENPSEFIRILKEV